MDSKIKENNDRVDSLKLAKLHLVGMLPESHLLEQEERIKRDLLIQGKAWKIHIVNKELNHRIPQKVRSIRRTSGNQRQFLREEKEGHERD